MLRRKAFFMTPFLLIPPIKDYIWGGTRLRDEFGKQSELERLSESWELSCHKDGESIIGSGEFEGVSLTEFIAAHPEALGTNCGRFEYFPVLIKLIDAKDNLSVQVHPDNEYAQRVEGEYGKTEMWYIVDADEGAELLYGFKHEISKEEFRERIENNTLLEVTNNVPVHKGDVLGTMTLTYNGMTLTTVDLIATASLERSVTDEKMRIAKSFTSSPEFRLCISGIIFLFVGYSAWFIFTLQHKYVRKDRKAKTENEEE